MAVPQVSSVARGPLVLYSEALDVHEKPNVYNVMFYMVYTFKSSILKYTALICCSVTANTVL